MENDRCHENKSEQTMHAVTGWTAPFKVWVCK